MSHHHEHDEEHDQAESGMWRREFLGVLGAGFAALGLTGCDLRPPKEKIVPYIDQPEGMTPGVANWYATTCGGCSANCGLLAKTREGRPIKLEGNPEHPMSRGGLCARGQASVLDLYDSKRLQQPLASGKASDWKTIDTAIIEKLTQVNEDGGQIRLLSATTTSPTTKKAIESFLTAYPTAKAVTYDTLSSSAIIEAHRLTHGQGSLPSYSFDKADVIVSFDADFLGTWISPVQYSKDWAGNRVVTDDDHNMSWHVQVEARLSPTGSNADLRLPVAPSKQLDAILQLTHAVADKMNAALVAKLAKPTSTPIDATQLDAIVGQLLADNSQSLIISGSDDLNVQLAVNLLNHLLGNYGKTLDITAPSLQRQGNDDDFDKLVADMSAGKVGALILIDANPAYASKRSMEFAKAIGKVELTVSLAQRQDETAKLVEYVCPDHHYLESWSDAQPRVGTYSLFQPTIAPLYNTRAAVESLLAWTGKTSDAYTLLRAYWQENIFPHQTESSSFENFWNTSVHDGVCVIESKHAPSATFDLAAATKINQASESVGKGFELVAYASIALGDGKQANNPWLQELPDPVSKATWGNYASVSPASAKQLGVIEGRVVEVVAGDIKVRLPIQIQLGMPDGVVSAALGYGREDAGEIAANYPMEKMFSIDKELLSGGNVYLLSTVATVEIRPTGEMELLAKTQTQDFATAPFSGHTSTVLKQMTLEEFEHGEHKSHAENLSLWKEHEYKGHHWAMSVDLNACTGCSGCVVGCQAENNVPVVGKVEIRKNRGMQWIRIDRYLSGSNDKPDANPAVTFQPMMCQHCDNAPCETVCPVLATVHSSEGLNVQAYNRCVGTRYCANNCPYKVRRFNWFDYAHEDPVQNLVLNPDVAVRSRGVMEKCSMCVQRIYEAKHIAKQENRPLADGDIQPACAQSCPSNAIVFGDLNDPSSQISKLVKAGRNFKALGELGVAPSVNYMTKIRNEKV